MVQNNCHSEELPPASDGLLLTDCRKQRWWHVVYPSLGLAIRQARRLIIFVIGITVLVIGVVMVVTPGPAIVVIPIGLGILALQFAWAQQMMRRLGEQVKKPRDRERDSRDDTLQ